MKTLLLVSCCGPKLKYPAQARDLYQSALFKKSRAYAERLGAPWVILSALYGVLAPRSPIEPYDRRVGCSGPLEYQQWAASVTADLLELTADGPTTIISLCGRDYVQHSERALFAAGHTLVEPMAGMPIGRRLQWLDAQLRNGVWDQPDTFLQRWSRVIEAS